MRGFTLVELLIVAVVLAVFAAVVVPNFGSTAQGAQESALRSSLQSIRSAVDLYYQQHGHYPTRVSSTAATACDGTTYAATSTEEGFTYHLTLYSNQVGHVCTTKSNGLYPYGPYLKSDEIPANAMTGSNGVVVVSSGSLILVADPDSAGNGGWKYDNVSGRVIVNSDGTDLNGARYDTY